jgi:ABC-type nitrate/sulfonate/bicarbonate transport system permease component
MYLALEGGLGALIMAYGVSFSTAPLFASIIVLSLIGVGTAMLVYWVEAKLTPWNENRSRV